jgi:hypothetical protein
MRKHHKYYRNNLEISRDEAFDGGVIRDGVSLRTHLTAMDSADNPHRRSIHDGTGSTQLHRPGWRMNTDTSWTPKPDANIAERQRSYDSYEDDLVNAYKNPFGIGDADTSAGSKGIRRKRGDKTPVGAGEQSWKLNPEQEEDGDDDEYGAGERRRKQSSEEDSLARYTDVPVRRPSARDERIGARIDARHSAENLDRMMKDHEARMDDAENLENRRRAAALRRGSG